MELLTINKKFPHRQIMNLEEPMMLIKELKQVVKELKVNNPKLCNYKLMDVGFPPVEDQKESRMKLYFVKKGR